MAKGKFITDIERSFIRIGYTQGHKQKHIAAAINRSPASVCTLIKAMIDDGTIGQTDMPFLHDAVRAAIEAKAGG